MATIRNKFTKPCTTCKVRVQVGQGWVNNDSGSWLTYCEEHLPTQKPTIVRRLDADGKVFAPYEPQNLGLFQSFPGGKYFSQKDGGPYWKVSLNLADRRRVLEIADELKLNVDPSLRDIPLSETATNAADAGLFPFQIIGTDWLTKGDKRLLADDMGLGKTIQALMAIPEMGAIVICPAGVKYNWLNEAKKWRPDIKVTVLEGRGAWRWPEPGELVITNGDILPERFAIEIKDVKRAWIKSTPGFTEEDKAKTQNCVLIVDEAHKFSNTKTLRSKRLNGLTIHCKKVWALTGTPLKNRPNHLYGMLDILEFAYDIFKGWRRFKELMGAYWNGYGLEWGEPDPIVPSLMRKVMLRRTKQEVLKDLPAKIERDLRIEISAELAKKMDALWEEWGDTILDQLKSNKPNLPPFEKFSALRAELAIERIPAVIEYVENMEEQETLVVVFSAHIPVLKALAEREDWAAITGETPSKKRTEIVQAFQDGKLKGVACSILAAGVGITLTRASHMLFVDQEWNPADNWQAIDRLIRIGQKATCVNVDRFVSNHALDIHILRLIDWKIKLIQGSIENDLKASGTDVQECDGETEEEAMERLQQRTVVEQEQQEKLTTYFASVNSWLDSQPTIEEDELIPF